MRLKLQILAILLLAARLLPAQSPEQVNAYINTYKFLAIAEMQRAADQGMPADLAYE